MLNGQELARVAIVLHIAVGFDEQLVASHETAAPASHVERLAGRVKLDADFLCARRGEKAERFLFENQSGISGIVNNNDAVAARKLHNFGEELRCGTGARGIIWII